MNDADDRADGRAAQAMSVTVLTNASDGGRPTLPLRPGARIHVTGVDAEVAARYGEVVADQAAADVTVIRLKAPFETRPGAFESMFHSGSLDFAQEELDSILATLRTGPTVVDVFLERPAILTPLVDDAASIVTTYGCGDEPFLDVLFGRAEPAGRLPVALPRSMAGVRTGSTDLPLDDESTLFTRGTGLDLLTRPHGTAHQEP